jgi:YspA, cpYpsA-related SLOG family
MKVIIAGSRSINNFDAIEQATSNCQFEITEVVSGGARGIDLLGEYWARKNQIPIKRFDADWNNLGRSAGYTRNVLMSDYADALIAIWDGQSRGTKHMIQRMKIKGKLVYVFEIN